MLKRMNIKLKREIMHTSNNFFIFYSNLRSSLMLEKYNFRCDGLKMTEET